MTEPRTIKLRLVSSEELARMNAEHPAVVGLPVYVDAQAFINAVWPIPDPTLVYNVLLEVEPLKG